MNKREKMASPSLTTRNKSSSPPIVSKQGMKSSSSSLSNMSTGNLEEFLTLFVSLIFDRSAINERSDLNLVLNENSTASQQLTSFQLDHNKCHIASKLKEKIRKCLADHYLNLERSENYLLDELITTQTTKDLQYLAKKQNTILLLNQAIHQQQDLLALNNETSDQSMTFHSKSIKSKIKPTTDILNKQQDEIATCKITIDVYLLPDCCFNELITNTGDNIIINQQLNDCHLLERWIFIMLTKRDEINSDCKALNSKSLLTLNELFQAIKSYLHFSQISSWINQSKGQQPKNIAYSVNCVNELQIEYKLDQSISTSTIQNQLTKKEFDFQSFPGIFINNKYNENSYLTRSKSCLEQFIHSKSSLNTLVRIDLYSKKRFDSTFLTSCPLNLVNQCHKLHLTKDTVMDTNNEKKDETTHKTLLLTNSNNILTTLLSNSTSYFTTNKTSMEDVYSQDILPQLSSDAISDNNQKFQAENDTDYSTMEHLNERKISFLNNKLPISFTSKNLKLPYTASFQLSNLNDENNSVASELNNSDFECLPKQHAANYEDINHDLKQNTIQDNNNNNCMLNLNKLKLKTTTCCSLKPVIVATCSTSINDDQDDSGFNSENLLDNMKQLKLIEPIEMIAKDNEENEDNSNHSNVNIENGKKQPVNLPILNCNKSSASEDVVMESDGLKSFEEIHSSTPKNILILNNKLNKINRSSNLPLSSSPAPLRKSGSSLFDFDNSLKNPRSIKNALSLNILNNKNEDDKQTVELDDSNSNNNSYLDDLRKNSSNRRKELMSLNPNHLLGSFEESLLNGRMNPVGVVDGFYAVIGASGSFFPEHATLPVNAAFYQVSEDIAASPYLGIINLASLGKRGYKVPSKGTIQVTLFNPNNTVVKMFIVMYDLSDMPPGHRTFLRQRTMYVPLENSDDTSNEKEDQIEHKSYLRYLIHLRFATSKSGKIYLHTNIKLIFARDKCEIDPSLARYEYKTLTEAPQKPKYSPKK